MRPTVATAAALLCVLAVPAHAQTASQARVHVSGDGLYQALFDPFSKSSVFPLFHETGTFTVEYPPGKSPAFAGSVAVRLWRSISIGGMVTRVQTRTNASIEGRIPHPFFFNRDRPVEGSAEGIERDERAVHLQFRLIIPVTRRLDLSVFAGPSRWQIHQQRITTLDYSSTYPFDTAQFTGVTLQEVNANTWGYNAGVDAGVYLTNHVGVGALLLIATANPDDTQTAATADTRIGGLRAGGGLRLRF